MLSYIGLGLCIYDCSQRRIDTSHVDSEYLVVLLRQNARCWTNSKKDANRMLIESRLLNLNAMLNESVVSITNINKAIKSLGYELVRGKGYHYFVPLTNRHPHLRNDSVMVNSLSQIPTIAGWVGELKDRIKETEDQ